MTGWEAEILGGVIGCVLVAAFAVLTEWFRPW